MDKTNKYSFYHMAEKSTWFKIQGYYSENFYSYQMKRHSHQRIEIMYAVSGSFITEILIEEKWKTIRVRSGELIVIDAGVPHSLLLPENYEARILNLELEVTHNSNSTFSMQHLCSVSESMARLISDPRPYLKYIDNYEIEKIIHAIHREMQIIDQMKESESEYMANLLLAQFWISLSRCNYENSRASILYLYVKKALEYIETYYNNDISVEDVSEYAGVHFSYLQKIFKKNTGYSIIKYVNKLRIERACLLLVHSDMLIEMIASEVGYNSRQNFIYTFKKFMEITPKEYRSNYEIDNIRVHYIPPETNKIEE